MAKVTFKNILAYITGNLRYKLFYSSFKFLIRRHIREQIEVRIASMDQECFENGSCKLCGCQTTHLQMANKACDKPCYPKMVDSYKWYMLSIGYSYKQNGITWFLQDNKFKILTNE